MKAMSSTAVEGRRNLLEHRFYRFSASLIVILALVMIVGCGTRGAGKQGGDGENETYTIQLSHVVATDTAKGLAAERFKEVVEENSEGRITVEVFPNSQLYGDEDEMQALQAGSVQMLAPTTSKFITLAPQLQVLDLPFIFDTYEDISTVTARDTAVGQAIYEDENLAASNIKVLALWADGFKQFAANRPIRTPNDFNGLKFRVQPADVLRSMFSAWGASPQPIAFGELFTALQQGVVDGHENPYAVIYGSKTYQVQPYITESDHGANISVVTINQGYFDSLPEDLQQILIESADEAATFNRENAQQINEDGKRDIEESGTNEIIELSNEEREAFKAVVVPSIWDEYADVIGPDVIEELKAKQG